MNRLQAWWIGLRASLWFVPGLIVAASLAGAAALVEAQGWIDDEAAQAWPRLLGASAEGSRGMLGAIATSMMTVAGVVFSITMVALSLASSQFSPRILRNFMRDRITQGVLGVFVGVFAYCLVVLRAIRGPDDGNFIPSLAVLGAMGYVLGAIGLLIYFIHHVADSIQASSILVRIAGETGAAIDRLFPQDIGQPASGPSTVDAHVPATWTVVMGSRTGYILGVDGQQMLDFAAAHDRVVRLPENGRFVVAATPLLEVSGAAPLSAQEEEKLRAWVSIGRQRTVEQDAAFGIQQLVDMAVKALSPGINDPTTACMCLDQLCALLTRLASRCAPDPHRLKDGRLRVIAPAPGFADLATLAFGAILRSSRGNLEVLARALDALTLIRDASGQRACRQALAGAAQGVCDELRKLERSAPVLAIAQRAWQVEHSLRAPARAEPAPAAFATPDRNPADVDRQGPATPATPATPVTPVTPATPATTETPVRYHGSG
ncbi:MAG: DUF2254 domain-containing protein [Pseudomonadota bacterium]|nr:DUF2254 domain-containing protein [Pseudomonadota bacterium]